MRTEYLTILAPWNGEGEMPADIRSCMIAEAKSSSQLTERKLVGVSQSLGS